jgi:ATP-dependent helicase/nuclease subunit B
VPPPDYQPSDEFVPDVTKQAFARLERGQTVVTGNDRAARALRNAYDAVQRARGRKAWQTPGIFGWDAWLSNLWNQYLLNDESAPMLLAPLQERSIWKRIVGGPTGSTEGIAKLASKAWQLLSEFEEHGERRRSWRPHVSVDALAFQNWAAAFERECRANRWMSWSDLPALLVNAMQESKIALPREIALAGFDRFTPAQQALLAAARAAGCTVEEIGPSGNWPRARFVEAHDLRDELAACAWWARRQLEADPSANIAVLVQGVDKIRGEIDRTFRAILLPGARGVESTVEADWEFSLGQPLSSMPVIKAAILLLRWMSHPLNEAEISWLLISGFFGIFGEDITNIAKLDTQLRATRRISPEVSIGDFTSSRHRDGGETPRRVFGALRDLQRAAAAGGIGQRRQTIPGWLDFANSLLRRSSWPGTRTLDSLEYQALNRWDRFHGEIAALGFDDRLYSYAEFVTMLDRYGRETIFSPESRNRPIQIMGAFESSGQTFDSIWFLGVDDNQWPPAGQPNPLLPQSLQGRAGMPHAAMELDWQVALAVTQRIASSAAECVFSYSRRNSAGDLRPSPLPTEVCGDSLQSLSSEELRRSLRAPASPPHQCLTSEIEDATSIPWPRHLHAGGVEILKMQSACPFQAFATRRLGAEELDQTERGLSPADRGTLLHRVLEAVWSPENLPHLKIANRDDLVNAKAADRLGGLLSDHISRVFDEYAAEKPSEWSAAYLQVERERLHALLSQWLDYELERSPFTVVEHEKKLRANINGLELDLRADRIDAISEGRLIVDYKTGVVSTSMWASKRPEEPQVPLYAIHGGISDLKGVMFAQIRAGLLRFSGHIENESVVVTNKKVHQIALAKTRLDDELLGKWSNALTSLADRFLDGEAAVTPRSYPKTCKYCALPSLCRVAETAVSLDAVDDDDEMEEGDAVFGSSPDE